ncbi:hypothetical protein JL720_7971 [Aureococcus anophagefferens]|nr:hypothetical protein JL720_7971 [Aureococcus anophagefferens]
MPPRRQRLIVNISCTDREARRARNGQPIAPDPNETARAPPRSDGRRAPVVWFDGAEDVPKRVRRSRAVSVGVAYRSDDDAPAAVCLHDTCGGGDDACVDVVGPAATSQLNHGFGHCAPGAHALTVYAADGSSSATLEFDVAATPMVEAAVSQTAVTTNDTALITVAVAADGRGALELCTMSPCGDWLHHLHNFHCRPIPKTGETAFDVTVGFANCEPGQRSLYFAPGDAPGAYDAATAYTTGGQFKQGGAGVASSWRRQADLLGALFGAGADIDVLEFGVHLVYSHSVLSHAGSRTLDAYLEATSAFLHDDGIAVASRSASVYPWVSWHSPAGLRAAAARFGLEVLHVADDVAGALRSGMMQGGRIEGDWHEWVVLARPGMGLDAGARARLLAFGHNAP